MPRHIPDPPYAEPVFDEAGKPVMNGESTTAKQMLRLTANGQELMLSLLDWAHKLASRARVRCTSPAMQDDLHAAAEDGLLKAVLHYDPSKAAPSTYAATAVTNAIERFFEVEMRRPDVYSREASTVARRSSLYATEHVSAGAASCEAWGADDAERDAEHVDHADHLDTILSRIDPEHRRALESLYGIGGDQPVTQDERARGEGVTRQAISNRVARAITAARAAVGISQRCLSYLWADGPDAGPSRKRSEQKRCAFVAGWFLKVKLHRGCATPGCRKAFRADGSLDPRKLWFRAPDGRRFVRPTSWAMPALVKMVAASTLYCVECFRADQSARRERAEARRPARRQGRSRG